LLSILRAKAILGEGCGRAPEAPHERAASAQKPQSQRGVVSPTPSPGRLRPARWARPGSPTRRNGRRSRSRRPLRRAGPIARGPRLARL